MDFTKMIDIIVPVLGRPQNAKPFMESLEASCTPEQYIVWAVPSAGDFETAKAWVDAGAGVLPFSREPGSFAQKVNDAYTVSSAPWLLLVGDDVKFHPGWREEALKINKPVIGINTDPVGAPHNGLIIGSPHLMVNRKHVELLGTSYDGPNTVCHEGYRHNFVDAEICKIAADRGMYSSAPKSVIEHLHPMYAKANYDETYKLGDQYMEQDRKLFQSRIMSNPSCNYSIAD